MKNIRLLCRKYLDLFVGFFSYITNQEKKMGKIFDWQMSELEKKGIPVDLLLKFRKRKKQVVDFACHHVYYPTFFETIPFFPVVPYSILKEKFEFALFSLNQENKCPMNVCESIDADKIYHKLEGESQEPYFIFGGETGLNENSVSYMSIRQAMQAFDKIELKPMNVVEVFSLLLLFSSLYNGNGEKISVLGSRFRKEDFIPEFIRSRDGFKLSNDLIDSSDRKKVFPAYLQKHFF